MGDIAWPSRLKPIVSRGYSQSRGSNVVRNAAQSGMARQALAYTYEAVPFTVALLVDTIGRQAFYDFYDGALNHGANSFPMQLDSGHGIETHQCIITSQVQENTTDGLNWALGLTITAERTPSQDVPLNQALYPLWDIYGTKDLLLVLADLEELATVKLALVNYE